MIVVKFSNGEVFLIIVRVICKQISAPLNTKNGILIFVMKGFTTTVAFVIISCQYKVNNKYDEIENGHESSIKAA